MMHFRRYHRQQGTVLVTVLMMFAIAAFLAAEMGYRQKLDVRRTAAMLQTEQAREYLLGAEDLAKLALKEDYKADKKNNNKFVDGLGEDWALKRKPFPVEGGFIQGELIDAQSKFNINNLIKADTGKPNPIAKEQFIGLLNALGIPKDGSPEAVYEKVLDWLDKDQDEAGPDGREDGAYLGKKRAYRTAGEPIADISELRAIDGMDAETFKVLEQHIVALPPPTQINLNTAEQELLSAAKVTDEKGLLATREQKPIDKNDLANVVPRAPQGQRQEDYNEMFNVSSEYFELRAKAQVGERSLYSRSIIHREPGQPSQDSTGRATGGNGGKLQVIYRAFVDPLQQPMTTPANNNKQSGS